jgi:F-type H+-transporting ATPase subunit gamma
MPNVLDLRRRIRSVKNMRQITRAMKMVAAARLKRAQERVMSARPYANQILAVLGRVAVRIQAAGEPSERALHPLLAERPVNRILLVLITADRGLSGAFNANLIRAAQGYLERHREEVSMLAVGRKGRDFFRKHGVNMKGDYVNIFGRLEFAQAQQIGRQIIELYSNESVDAVDFIYNEFKSIMAQRLVVERYLPVKPIRPTEGEAVIDYLYEQSPQQIYDSLLPRYVESQVYRALLESQAAELAAKMTAMDAATNNAAELIDSLTLYLNRVRQAAITKEIIEIVSGASSQ